VWVVVYVARSSSAADRILDELSKNGILARSRQIRHKHGEIRHYEILVPEAELDEACQLLGRALMGR
jgi:predicted transcriptional regulator